MEKQLDLLKTALADRYTVEEEIGAGGMATVYLAEDLKHHRKVAVKVLRPAIAAVVGSERFLREIVIAARLTHPHILPLHDSGEAGGFLYYVMPYVEGESLRDKLNREKQQGVDETIEIAGEVAAALDYAHARGIVHRDIKPENILLVAGQAVVADFGVALAVSQAGGSRLTQSGLSLGTPHYMSPEQATGDQQPTGRSDVYSLGAVVYEMLAGDPPHTASTTQALMAKVMTEPPPSVRLSRDTIPDHVDLAVRKALAKVPADRFATAQLFAEAVAGATMLPGSTVASISHLRQPIAVSIWVVALVGFAMVLVAGLAVWPLVRPESVLTENVSRWILPTRAPQQLVPPDRPTQRVRIRLSPDGSRLVYVGGSSTDRKLFLRRLDALETVPIPGTEGAYSVFFHPDGDWIVFPVLRPNVAHQLKMVRLPGGPAAKIAELPLPSRGGSYVEGGTWGRDDTIIFGRQREGLYRVEASGGEPRVLTTPADGESHVWPHLLPGGRAVLFTAAVGRFTSSDHSVWVLDLQSGRRDSLMDGRDARYSATSGHLVYSGVDGVLSAIRFDSNRLELRGDPLPVLDEIERSPRHGDFTLSDDGTLAYVPQGQDFRERLVLVDRQGLAGPLMSLRASFYFPRFSHDGTRVAVNAEWADSPEGTWDIHVVDSGGGLLRITSGRTAPSAAWSPDDDTLAYAGGHIFWTAAVGGGQPDSLLVHRSFVSLDWSRDGRSMVFQDLQDGQYDLWHLSVDGDRTPVRLPMPGGQSQAKFAPNGRYVAYVSDESGRDEVHVRRFPLEVGTGTWPITQGGGAEPVWGPDGTELFYWNEGRLMVVPTRTDGAFSFGRPTLLFDGSGYKRWPGYVNYDVHPDGDRFIMIQNPTSTDVVLVLNWFEELRAITGN